MTSPLNNLTDTWNNGSTVFTGLKYNITNTASAAGSKLFDFQVSAVSKFGADKDGIANIAGDGSTTGIKVTNNEIWGQSGNLYLGVNSTDYALIGTLEFRIGGIPLGLSSGPYSSSDVFLNRDGAGLLAQRNSTNAQTLRVYNTYTDASNYERGVFDWTTTANVLTIGTQALGTGSVRNIQFSIGGTIRADYGITLSGTWEFATSVRVGAGAIYFNSSNGFAQSFVNGGYGWTSGSANGTLDTAISRSAAGVIAIGNGSAADVSGTIAVKTKAGAFAAGDIPSGTWIVGRDTSGATTKLYYNNAGTLMTVALT